MAEKDVSARLRRAVKENNLFLVKRLLNRTTDIRNVDPAAPRYTSLAWAAVLGHEEVFDFLLSKGHDDYELSKDAENNTILMLLAGLRQGANTPYSTSRVLDSLQEAALRMARSYFERFPFILDWSNVQGKTALHVASLHGNEEFATMLCDFNADMDLADFLGNTPLHYASSWGHISIIKFLIDRGCQFAARNNEGYTATDYAYSTTTKEKLEDSGRAAHDARRSARRPAYAQLKTQTFGDDANRPPLNKKDTSQTTYPRIRSGSGTTTTSESADEVIPHAGPTSLSSSSSVDSSQTSGGSLNRRTPPPSSGFMSNGILNSSRHNLRNTLAAKGTHQHSILSPVANRVRANDAGAMAEYIKRNRSGSQGEPSQHIIVEPSSSHVTRNGGSKGSIDDPAQRYTFRRLRPSISAAALNQSSPASIIPRFRAGTNPSSSRPSLPFTMQSSVDAEDAPNRTTPKRGAKLSSLQEPDDAPPGNIPPVPPPKDTGSSHQQHSSLS